MALRNLPFTKKRSTLYRMQELLSRAENAEVQQKVAFLAAHPSMKSLSDDPKAAIAAVLLQTSLRRGATQRFFENISRLDLVRGTLNFFISSSERLWLVTNTRGPI